MQRFHIIEEGQVILYRKGVYSQVPLYRRGNHLYAGLGKGFVQLYVNGTTSHPDVKWKDIEQPFALTETKFGHMEIIEPKKTGKRRKADA